MAGKQSDLINNVNVSVYFLLNLPQYHNNEINYDLEKNFSKLQYGFFCHKISISHKFDLLFWTTTWEKNRQNKYFNKLFYLKLLNL